MRVFRRRFPPGSFLRPQREELAISAVVQGKGGRRGEARRSNHKREGPAAGAAAEQQPLLLTQGADSKSQGLWKLRTRWVPGVRASCVTFFFSFQFPKSVQTVEAPPPERVLCTAFTVGYMPSVHFQLGTSVKVFETCHFFPSLFAKMLLRLLTTTCVTRANFQFC